MKATLYMLSVFTFSTISHAATDETELVHLKELDKKCEEARAAKLKPLQEEKIEECVNIDKKDRAWCERYFKDYGWGSKTATGTRNPRMFDQIPECVEAFEAWNNRER